MKKPLYIIRIDGRTIGMFSSKAKSEAVFEEEWQMLKRSFSALVTDVEKAEPYKYYINGDVGKVFESVKNSPCSRRVRCDSYERELDADFKYTYENRKIFSRSYATLTLEEGEFDDSEV